MQKNEDFLLKCSLSRFNEHYFGLNDNNNLSVSLRRADMFVCKPKTRSTCRCFIITHVSLRTHQNVFDSLTRLRACTITAAWLRLKCFRLTFNHPVCIMGPNLPKQILSHFKHLNWSEGFYENLPKQHRKSVAVSSTEGDDVSGDYLFGGSETSRSRRFFSVSL